MALPSAVHLDFDAVGHAQFLRQPAALRPVKTGRVRFIHHKL